jgi:hypothetical protein
LPKKAKGKKKSEVGVAHEENEVPPARRPRLRIDTSVANPSLQEVKEKGRSGPDGIVRPKAQHIARPTRPAPGGGEWFKM